MSENCVTEPQPGCSSEVVPVVEDGDEAGGSSPGRSSPEGNCPICLGKPENKSFTDSCFHQFCYLCLLEWSKVKAECPLCKRAFTSIIHTVKSMTEYQQHHIASDPANRFLNLLVSEPTWHTPIHHRESFRYRTTAVNSYLDYVVRLEQAMNERVLPSFGHPTVTYTQRRQNGTSNFRRNIYQQGLWVQRVTDVTGRYRDCSPEFYRSNPAQSHRLVPWLNRELNVLCGGHDVQQVVDRILHLITEVPIRSPAFSNAVSRYIGRHTDHFVHEFHSFATSPYDLVGYDRHTNYVSRSALAHLTTSDNNEDSNDSDVQFVSTTPSTMPPIHLLESDSDDVMVVGSNVPQQEEIQTRPPIEVVTLDSDDDVVQVNISLNMCSENEPRRPPKRRKLRRNWLTVSDLNMPSTSRDTMNVSINIERSRTSSTSSDSSSSSSWSPHRVKRIKKKSKKDSKIKGKRCVKRKSSKIELTVSNDPKSSIKGRKDEHSTNSTKVDIERPSTSREIQQPKPINQHNEPSSEEDIDVLRIETDQELTSSDESDYKPRLRSVVFKSEVKVERLSPKREILSPPLSPELRRLPSPCYSSNSSINSVSNESSDNDSSDLYKPSFTLKRENAILKFSSSRKHQSRNKYSSSKKYKRSHSKH